MNSKTSRAHTTHIKRVRKRSNVLENVPKWLRKQYFKAPLFRKTSSSARKKSAPKKIDLDRSIMPKIPLDISGYYQNLSQYMTHLGKENRTSRRTSLQQNRRLSHNCNQNLFGKKNFQQKLKAREINRKSLNKTFNNNKRLSSSIRKSKKYTPEGKVRADKKLKNIQKMTNKKDFDTQRLRDTLNTKELNILQNFIIADNFEILGFFQLIQEIDSKNYLKKKAQLNQKILQICSHNPENSLGEFLRELLPESNKRNSNCKIKSINKRNDHHKKNNKSLKKQQKPKSDFKKKNSFQNRHKLNLFVKTHKPERERVKQNLISSVMEESEMLPSGSCFTSQKTDLNKGFYLDVEEFQLFSEDTEKDNNMIGEEKNFKSKSRGVKSNNQTQLKDKKLLQINNQTTNSVQIQITQNKNCDQSLNMINNDNTQISKSKKSSIINNNKNNKNQLKHPSKLCPKQNQNPTNICSCDKKISNFTSIINHNVSVSKTINNLTSIAQN